MGTKNTNGSIRGDLLQFIGLQYPSKVSEKSVVAAYFDYYKPVIIRQSLAYLADSGYLATQSVPNPSKRDERFVFYTATPKGIDLVEKTTSDPGVIIVEDGE